MTWMDLSCNRLSLFWIRFGGNWIKGPCSGRVWARRYIGTLPALVAYLQRELNSGSIDGSVMTLRLQSHSVVLAIVLSAMTLAVGGVVCRAQDSGFKLDLHADSHSTAAGV